MHPRIAFRDPRTYLRFPLVISELRFRGPNGANDEFVEISIATSQLMPLTALPDTRLQLRMA